MIYSEVLCKEYKTAAAVKAQLKKYINEQTQELNEIRAMIKNKAQYYLGEPIIIAELAIERDLDNAQIELNKLNK